MICSKLQNSVWINGQKSIGNPRLKLKIHDFQCITDVGVASSRLAELELLRYKKEVNVKSRLIKLVLLPLWYGNKDIIRDSLS